MCPAVVWGHVDICCFLARSHSAPRIWAWSVYIHTRARQSLKDESIQCQCQKHKSRTSIWTHSCIIFEQPCLVWTLWHILLLACMLFTCSKPLLQAALANYQHWTAHAENSSVLSPPIPVASTTVPGGSPLAGKSKLQIGGFGRPSVHLSIAEWSHGQNKSAQLLLWFFYMAEEKSRIHLSKMLRCDELQPELAFEWVCDGHWWWKFIHYHLIHPLSKYEQLSMIHSLALSRNCLQCKHTVHTHCMQKKAGQNDGVL